MPDSNRAVTVEDLRAAAPLASWPQEALERVARESSFRVCESGELLGRTGEAPRWFWVIVEGWLELVRYSAGGGRYLSDVLAPPQVAGLTPLMDGRPNLFDTRARVRSRVIQCPNAALAAEMEADASLAMAMAGMVCFRQRMEHDRAVMIALDPIEVQVAKAILYMGRRRGLLDADGQPALAPVTYEDMAAFLGIAVSGAVRVVKGIIAAGAVRKQYGGIVIADIDRLVALTEARGPLNSHAREYISDKQRV